MLRTTYTYTTAKVLARPRWETDLTKLEFYLQDFSAPHRDDLPLGVVDHVGCAVRYFETAKELTEFCLEYPCVIEELVVLPFSADTCRG